jgi:hypothetical protein
LKQTSKSSYQRFKDRFSELHHIMTKTSSVEGIYTTPVANIPIIATDKISRIQQQIEQKQIQQKSEDYAPLRGLLVQMFVMLLNLEQKQKQLN